MKILTNYNELVGKKIAFVNMARFADQITLATEDGCLLMVTVDGDGDEDKEVRVYSEISTLRELKNDRNDWMRKDLAKLGIFDMDEYIQEQKEIRERKQLEFKKEQERKEYEKYLQLKEKYEGGEQHEG